ncbi:hypothetical protein JCM11641_000453 [Rhodosporidiobolus odoratus]
MSASSSLSSGAVPPPELASSGASDVHFLPATYEEIGAIRRQAFSSSDNDAESLSTDQLFAEGAKLKDKVLVITGAGSQKGFGGSLAMRAAVEYGAKVVVSDVREGAVAEVVKVIQDKGGKATGIACDVTSWEDQVRMFRHAVDTFGQVDVVVANAGMGDDAIALLDETTTETGEPAKPTLQCLDVDLVGVIYSAKLAFYHLRRSPSKDVKAFLAVGSVSSYFAFPTQVLYAASKHGTLGLTRALHYDGLENGIKVSCIAPWIVDTPILGGAAEALVGVPMAKLEDVVGAMVTASTTADGGKTYVIDEQGVYSLPHKSSGYLAK